MKTRSDRYYTSCKAYSTSWDILEQEGRASVFIPDVYPPVYLSSNDMLFSLYHLLSTQARMYGSLQRVIKMVTTQIPHTTPIAFAASR